MFERFTDQARRIVVLAQEEARLLNHNYIGTEHLLLGLEREDEGIAAKALVSLGVKLDTTRQQVVEIIGKGKKAPSGHIPFTPRAKKVLELSLREALQLGHDYIDTEHILLGLLREGGGVAVRILAALGADPSSVRRTVIGLTPAEEADRGDVFARGSQALRRPMRMRAGVLDEILGALTGIRDRLAAIETQLGISGPQLREPASQAADDASGDQAAQPREA
jgi:ATP-dependent Clp protease ATP-binding subunit ClpC